MPRSVLGYAALAVLLLIAAAFLVVRVLRARREEAARAAASAAAAKEREAELLDSSHVGFAPLIDGVSWPPETGPGTSADRK